MPGHWAAIEKSLVPPQLTISTPMPSPSSMVFVSARRLRACRTTRSFSGPGGSGTCPSYPINPRNRKPFSKTSLARERAATPGLTPQRPSRTSTSTTTLSSCFHSPASVAMSHTTLELSTATITGARRERSTKWAILLAPAISLATRILSIP